MIIDIEVLQTGGHNFLFYGKLNNGLYFAYGMDEIILYNDDYKNSFNDNGMMWEKRHKVKHLIGCEEIAQFKKEIIEALKKHGKQYAIDYI